MAEPAQDTAEQPADDVEMEATAAGSNIDGSGGANAPSEGGEDSDDDVSESSAGEDGSDADEEPSKKPWFDERLKAVTKALEDVEPPGAYVVDDFCAVFPQPAITVEGLGPVALPVVGEAAKALVAKCHLAPYGHGEKTIVDTDVRNTWELSADQFHLANPNWNKFIQEQVVPACRVPLGIHESVQYEAKLYKLLLYEAGGKFDQHKDSEKEDGMFGTLVVVLPGQFEGGELVVRDPSFSTSEHGAEPYVWNPAAMDPYAIKYAAFYGDCPHEVKPVVSGYRVCLTYNLVVTQNVEAGPRFGANHPKYAALKAALCEFFRDKQAGKTKRQKLDGSGASQPTGFDMCDPETHRSTKLVYVLNHKYTKAGLSFQYLKNKDALVAASLAQFCEDSQDAFVLYLCKVKYEFHWSGDPDTWYDSDGSGSEADAAKTLVLYSPWVEYAGFVGKGTAVGTERCVVAVSPDKKNLEGDLQTEVSPAGLFDLGGFEFDGENAQEYTGNEGALLEKWYSSAALVVMTVTECAQLAFVRDSQEALSEWVATADTNASKAYAMARGFGCVPQDWSLASPESEPVVEAVLKVKRLDVFRDMVLSCERVEFQPKLRELMHTFCHEAIASTVKGMSSIWADRDIKSRNEPRAASNRVNIVASLLEGETDATAIKTILGSVDLKPFARCPNTANVTYYKTDTPPKDYARVLQLASRVSAQCLTDLLPDTHVRTLVMIVAPAVLLWHGTVTGDDTTSPMTPEEIQGIVGVVRGRLEKVLPDVRNWPYNAIYSWRCRTDKECPCKEVQAFLKSEEQSIQLDTEAVEAHLWPIVAAHESLGKLLSKSVCAEVEGKTTVKKSFESKFYLKARESWTQLGRLLHV